MMYILRNQRGATLVFVALLLLPLMMFLGLAVDSGILVFVRTQGQARVDAAALAGAAGLIHPNAGIRQSSVTGLVTTFSDTNTVVNGSVNPDSIVVPMSYQMTTGAITDAQNWSPGNTGLNCNAIEVSTTVPTPVFFSGVRAVFGGNPEHTAGIHVKATATLPCPGQVLTTTAQGLGPIALRQCEWSFPDSCDSTQRLYQTDGQSDNSLWITYNLGANTKNCKDIADGTLPVDIVERVKIGDTVNVNNGQVEPCLRTLRDTYRHCSVARCNQEPADPDCTVIVPVVDCNGSTSGATVIGFASICFTGFDAGSAPKWVEGALECGEYASGSAGTGMCMGTYASNPILIR